MNTVLILAGGIGSRLYPLTLEKPKSLIKINNKPFIEYQLDYLKNQKIENVVISIGKFGWMIEEHVQTLKNIELNIHFSSEGENLLGTGGAIKNSLSKLTQDFFVIYGDSFLPVNFGTIQRSYNNGNKLALMTIYKNKNSFDRSNVAYKNNKILNYNKNSNDKRMEYIDYGLSIFSKKSFDKYDLNSKFDLSEVFLDMLKINQLNSYVVNDRFYEIGSFKGIKDFENYLKTS